MCIYIVRGGGMEELLERTRGRGDLEPVEPVIVETENRICGT